MIFLSMIFAPSLTQITTKLNKIIYQMTKKVVSDIQSFLQTDFKKLRKHYKDHISKDEYSGCEKNEESVYCSGKCNVKYKNNMIRNNSWYDIEVKQSMIEGNALFAKIAIGTNQFII